MNKAERRAAHRAWLARKEAGIRCGDCRWRGPVKVYGKEEQGCRLPQKGAAGMLLFLVREEDVGCEDFERRA